MDNIMIDMETLGVSVSSPIISIAAVFFGTDGSVGKTFYRVVDLKSALSHGQVEPSTLAWWMSQSDEARKIFFDPNATSLDLVLRELDAFIREDGNSDNVKVWGNGPSFDNAILAQAYRDFGVSLPWRFRNDRDVRTIVDLAKCLKNIDPVKLVNREGVHHNALSDALFQIECVSIAYRALQG
ncbi:3'-5' exonuclease [Klebsiella electrica]|uniref:3'-5' exonuclease n=1 Tax=Klebsiella michiganensis TaxID=1134687 RepID=UPI00224784EC|nr:3'-5' exonuclease [Klebsiella michiganensis]MCW9340273.1 3'-5' exoribonuclease [Klebsiella michiganensis]